MDFSLPLAFTVGLFSTLHCVGMCGGIMGALSFSLPASYRSDWRRSSPYILAYNLGRVLSYALAGALMGSVGAALISALGEGSAHLWLRWGAGLIMVGIGLHIAGWFPAFARLEQIGAPLWKMLEPYGRRLMPVDSLAKAVVFGAVWGWLPCGLVYTMLITTATLNDAAQGAMFMAVFGLGTLPTLMAAGLFAGRVYQWAQRPLLKPFIGVMVIAMGVATMVFQGMEVKLPLAG